MRWPALLVAAAVCTGCGKTVPYGGVEKPTVAPEQTVTTVTGPTDLMPADLDLVIRLDLAKIRSDLGKEASFELVNEAMQSSAVRGEARAALADADVVWLGLRVADFDVGDHVMIATRAERTKKTDGDKPAPRLVEPEANEWQESATSLPALKRFVAKRPPTRAGTARIFTMAQSAAVFVSPVEEHSVERVLARGPDPERGNPRALGLVSIDLREPRLSPRLATEVPALATLVASVVRVRATADLFGDRFVLEGTIRCRDAASAAKVETYLATFTSPNTRFAELTAGAAIERSGASVSLRWRIPQAVITELLARQQGVVP